MILWIDSKDYIILNIVLLDIQLTIAALFFIDESPDSVLKIRTFYFQDIHYRVYNRCKLELIVSADFQRHCDVYAHRTSNTKQTVNGRENSYRRTIKPEIMYRIKGSHI